MEEKTKEERARRLKQLIEELHQGTDYEVVKNSFLSEFKTSLRASLPLQKAKS
jgi:DUF438 domain-containing protein